MLYFGPVFGQCGSVGWSIIPLTKRLWVQVPVWTHTQLAGSASSWGAYEKATDQRFSLTSVFPSLSPFLSPSLSFSISPPSSLSRNSEEVSSDEDKNNTLNSFYT